MTMSQMSPKQRREVIRENIVEHTVTEIAKMCHVTKRTILRDISEWKREGGFEEFLMDEFFRSYPTIKTEYPDKAFDRLCYLLGKTVTQKRQIEVEETINEKQEVNFTIDCLDPEERELARSIARRYIKANRKDGPASIH